jgi:hypothetical protein
MITWSTMGTSRPRAARSVHTSNPPLLRNCARVSARAAEFKSPWYDNRRAATTFVVLHLKAGRSRRRRRRVPLLPDRGFGWGPIFWACRDDDDDRGERESRKNDNNDNNNDAEKTGLGPLSLNGEHNTFS